MALLNTLYLLICIEILDRNSFIRNSCILEQALCHILNAESTLCRKQIDTKYFEEQKEWLDIKFYSNFLDKQQMLAKCQEVHQDNVLSLVQKAPPVVKIIATKQKKQQKPCGSETPIVKQLMLLLAHCPQILEC